VVQVTPLDPKASVLLPRPEYPYYWNAETDDQGYVEYRGLPSGEFLIVATRDDRHALGRVHVTEHGAVAEAELRLAANTPLSGTVRDSGGAPLAGAVVAPVAARDWAGDGNVYRHAPVVTDADGKFTHTLLPPGSWEFLVAAEGFGPKLVRPARDGRVDVRLDQGQVFQGRVVRLDGGKPLSNVKLAFTAVDTPGEEYVIRSGSQGHFRLERLRPAPYRIQIDSEVYFGQMEVRLEAAAPVAASAALPAERDMKVDPLTGEAFPPAGVPRRPAVVAAEAPDRPRVDFVVGLAGGVRGRVLESGAGVGFAGVEVRVRPIGRAGAERTASSDQSGYYQVKGLEAGDYEAYVPRDGNRVFVASPEGGFSVVAGQQAKGPVFHESVVVAVSGRVLHGTGRSARMPNVVVEITGYPGGALVYAGTEEGGFQVGGLHPTDQVRLRAEWMGQRSPDFGPVTLGASGLQGILLKIDESP
jgi:hypothetical protein